MRGGVVHIPRADAVVHAERPGVVAAEHLAEGRAEESVDEAERGEIIRLRNSGVITDEIMRRIERDLDLEDARLDI